MQVLLDTNIIIHRESVHVLNKDIGILFKWLDDLNYKKCIHPVTIDEINKLKSNELRDLMNVKMGSYNKITVKSPIHNNVLQITNPLDKTENDKNDTTLLNELYLQRVDYLITEDRGIIKKATLLGIADRVFTIDAFLEKVTAENPSLVDYRVLAVRKEKFGNININDEFFDSFKEDYIGFERWFNKKSEEIAYICEESDKTLAFLYLKVEGKNEPYNDITPNFPAKKRLKIGTLKVDLNGFKLGERFLKIIFDNAIQFLVDEVYVTIFDKRVGQQRLIRLLEDFGFIYHGIKSTTSGDEKVYIRKMDKSINLSNPKSTYPYISKNTRKYIVPIYPEYHTQLLPDSILRTESPSDFVENEPFRNAISKVYVSRSIFRGLKTGDLIVFYRTGGFHLSVVTTIGIVESVHNNIKNLDQFVRLCRKRSVFTDEELAKQWNYNTSKPFVVNFLYTYSFPKRPNLKRLIELGVIKDKDSAPRGFEPLSDQAFNLIIQEAQVDARIIVN